jgi:hypothetical protein
MVAVFGGFADPKLADRTAVDKDIVHSGSPDVLDASRPTKSLPRAEGGFALRIVGYIAMHHAFDNPTTGIPGSHQMKLNS